MCGSIEQCEYITGLTRSGGVWVPQFIENLKQENCAGCGRCYKACPRRVFELTEHPDGDYLGGHKVMSIANPGDCIGDGACQATCPKKNIVCRPVKKKEVWHDCSCT
jgi:Nif-specific ferredoxin III